jgi:hypothetical protein
VAVGRAGKARAGDFHELNGRAVRFRGERVYRPNRRGEDHMIELLSGSLSAGEQADAVPSLEDLGETQWPQ